MRSGRCGSRADRGRARPAPASARPSISSVPLQAALLGAREAREERIRRLASALGAADCLIAVTLSLPGAEKDPPGAAGIVELAAGLLGERLRGAGLRVSRPAGAGCGEVAPGERGPGVPPAERPLGPFAALAAAAPAERAKAVCVDLEESLPWGRLLDLDVYVASAASPLRQVGRGALGLPGRRCLLCGRTARECIVLRRHAPESLAARAAALFREAGRSRRVRFLAAALERGARGELDLTPKPGLVDRRDSGSHPDLSYAAMRRSIDLLPTYYAELIRVLETEAGSAGARSARLGAELATAALDPSGAPAAAGFVALGERALLQCVEAGRAAERRMRESVGANAHRGYIFLSGLALLAAWEAGSFDPARLRPSIASVATRFFGRAWPPAAGRGEPEASRGGTNGREVPADRPGERLRRQGGVGGIERESVAGLPAVFERALPCLRPPADARDERARWRALAELMSVLEDTTTLHRGGRAGLARVRADGRRLRGMLDRGEDPAPSLRRWNEEYRAAGLTMGGVADCLALALALEEAERWA